MKWVQEVWGLFVDDPRLAGLSLLALGVGFALARAGIREFAGLAVFLLVTAGLWLSVRHDD